MRRLVLGMLLVAAAGFGAYTFYTRANLDQKFITAAVERGTIGNFIKATGSVEPVITVDVSSQLSGRISEVFVDFNDEVTAGQPIARVDPEIFSAKVNEARAVLRVAQATALLQQGAGERARAAAENSKLAVKMADAQIMISQVKLDQAEKELQRKVQLVRSGSTTDRDLLQAQAQHDTSAAELRASSEDRNMKSQAVAMADADVRMAEANVQSAEAVVEQRRAALEQAQLDLDRTLIRAPIKGVIIKREVNPGQTVAVTLEAKTLFKIAQDLRQMEVRGKIDEADVGRLQVGQTASFSVDAYPNRMFSGRVTQIRKSPEVVQNVVTYTAIVSASNEELLLLPGMTAVVRVAVSDTGETLKIPNQALRFRMPNSGVAIGANAAADANSGTVWVVGKDGRPEAVSVALGARDENSTQMLSGALHEGQQVVIGLATAQSGAGTIGLRVGF
jgi:HlyD family secretion protein